MEKIIYVNQSNSITPKAASSDNLSWEIDDDDNLNTQAKPDGIIVITPDESALGNPKRFLRYTVEETGESEEFELIIKKDAFEKEPEAGVQSGELSDEKKLSEIIEIPVILKVSPATNVPIPGTRDMLNNVSWFFSNEKFNSHLKLSSEGVAISRLPAGLYTLYYQSAHEKQKEICIQSVARQPSQPQGQPSQPRQPQGQPSQPQKSENNEQNWPKIIEKCALEISMNGQKFKTFPIDRTRSLLVGKKSRSQKVVDIDLSNYSQNTDKISRNHLKLWINDEHLMMKNIGSHRVLYCEKEMFPDQLAVLKIGGAVKLGDITITVIRV